MVAVSASERLVRPRNLVVLLVASLPAARAAGQAGPPVPGDRVRVTIQESSGSLRHVGMLVALGGDSLVVMGERMALTWRLPSVTRLEVSRGRTSAWVPGAVIGAGVMGASSVVLFALVCTVSSAAEGSNCDQWGAGALFAVAGAAVGGLLGAGIGALIMHDCWEPVPLEYLRVTIGPAGGKRLALAVSLRF
jgi:hypothetical protein